jgi:alpha-1,2-mannosyltransferase
MSLGFAAMFICMALVGAALTFLRAFRRRRSGTGFVHPSSGGGGGGERVLWVAIKAMQDYDAARGIDRTYVLYTLPYGKSNSTEQCVADLLALVKQQFDIVLSRPIECVFLKPRVMRFLDAKMYPRLTLVLQSVCGGVALWWECAVANSCTPVIIETVGIPFSYPLFRIASGVEIVAYIHYPVISTDMIERVANRNEAFNNTSSVARSRVLTEAKLLYYRCFAWAYCLVGATVRLTMTNSTWTTDHVRSLWGVEPVLVYPPCNVKEFAQRAVARHGQRRDNAIVSVGQFRPEKNHALQLEAFAAALPRLPPDTVLYLAGGARNDEDRARVEQLKRQATALGIASNVEFCVSCPFERIAALLAVGLCGLHTMHDEHFGIVVVEYLAAGCVPVAHCSGGVQADIVISPSMGRLAVTREEYAESLVELFAIHNNDFSEFQNMQSRGAAHAQTFSDAQFSRKFVHAVGPVLR